MKGSSLLDPIFLGIWFIVFAAGTLICYMVFDNIAATGLLGIYANDMYGFFSAINNAAIFIALAMALGSIISAYLIKESPIFFVASIIFLFIMMMVLPQVVLFFNALAADSSMANATAGLNLLVFLAQELPVITLISSAIAALIGLTRG